MKYLLAFIEWLVQGPESTLCAVNIEIDFNFTTFFKSSTKIKKKQNKTKQFFSPFCYANDNLLFDN